MRSKILVVDDDPELLDLVRLQLKTAGFSVLTANTGVEALEKARNGSPILIVLDLVLPDLDGFTVCEILKKEPGTAQIPVILLTGLSSQLGRLAGIGSGANEYMTKPVTLHCLLSKINDLLHLPSEAVDAQARAG